jgi:hypothetical protein
MAWGGKRRAAPTDCRQMRTTTGNEARRTAWFDADTAPARRGVYERRAPAGPYACWDGSRWRGDAASAAAAASREGASPLQRAAWRGLLAAAPALCATCRGQTVIDRGVDIESGADLIVECPDC